MNIATTLRRLALALPALAFATGAGAQGIDPQRMDAFAASLYERMDADGDGLLTVEEYEHSRGGGFEVDYGLLDLNKDGTVTKEEYLVAVRHYHQPHGAKPI